MPTDIAYSDGSALGQWGGSARVAGDSLTLRYKDAATIPGLTVASRVFHYRPGTRGDLVNNPDNDRDAAVVVTDGGAAAVTGSGLVASPAHGAWGVYVEPGGPIEDYRFLWEPDDTTPVPVPPAPEGVIDSFIFACWGQLEADQCRTLMGGFLYPQLDNDPGQQDSALFQIGLLPGQVFVHMHNYLHGTREGQLYASFPIPSLSNLGDHLLLHVFWTKDNEDKHWWVRCYLNGEYVGDRSVPLSHEAWTALVDPAVMQMDMQGYGKPGLLATKRTYGSHTSGTHGVIGAEHVMASSNWVDEILLARCHPVLDEDDVPVVSHEWEAGDSLFQPTRFPDPTDPAQDASGFIVLSPVEYATYGPGSAIEQVFVDGVFAAGTSVAVSIRAAEAEFAPDDALPAWGPWKVLDEPERGVWASVTGTSTGSYVQMRLRLYPTSAPADPRCMQAPQLTDVRMRTNYMAWQWSQADHGGSLSIGTYADLTGRIFVIGNAQGSHGGRLAISADAEAYHVGRLGVMAWGEHAGTLEVTEQPEVYADHAGQIEVLDPWVVADHLGALSIVRVNGDHFGRLGIMMRGGHAGTLTVFAQTHAGRLGVQQIAQGQHGGRLTVASETPGAPLPLWASVPAATWQPDPLVTFWWGAAVAGRSPVLAYYWALDTVPFNEPDESWDDTQDLTATVNLAPPPYGAGRWHFHVAARNLLGHFGPTAHYEVRFNRTPAAPGTGFMRINGQDIVARIPLVPSSTPATLSWSPAADGDNEILSYEIQLSPSRDFVTSGENGTVLPLILINQVQATSVQLPQFSQFGLWHARIRASDGKQLSGWSTVGQFTVNRPPGAPAGLLVVSG